MKLVAIVGVVGSGKSEVAKLFKEYGFMVVRFGDITDEAVKAKGLPLTEENERPERERIRKENGMAAYARLSVPRIDAALKKSNVVVDGLYSWEEYLYLKDYYGDRLAVVAVWSPPDDRRTRLGNRRVRPLTPQEAVTRERAEIENLNKGGPIAIADFIIVNDSSLVNMKKQVEKIITRFI